MKKTIKRIQRAARKTVAGAAIVAGSLAGQQATAQTLEGIVGVDNDMNRARITSPYKISDNVSGFGFVDLYKNGYFARTETDVSIGRGINLSLRSNHTNFTPDEIMPGIKMGMPIGENGYGSIVAYPVGINTEGERTNPNIGYFVTTLLDLSVLGETSFMSFGGINPLNLGNHYFEAELTKQFGQVDVGVNYTKTEASNGPGIVMKLRLGR